MKKKLDIPTMIFITILFDCLCFTYSFGYEGNINISWEIIPCICSVVYVFAWILFIRQTNTKNTVCFALICGIIVFSTAVALLLSETGFTLPTLLTAPFFLFQALFLVPVSFLTIRVIPRILWYPLLIIISLIWIFACNQKLKRLK